MVGNRQSIGVRVDDKFVYRSFDRKYSSGPIGFQCYTDQSHVKYRNIRIKSFESRSVLGCVANPLLSGTTGQIRKEYSNVPFTDDPLSELFNIDVTELDWQWQNPPPTISWEPCGDTDPYVTRAHAWPHRYYATTLTDAQPTNGDGFASSVERRGDRSKLIHGDQHEPGAVCVLVEDSQGVVSCRTEDGFTPLKFSPRNAELSATGAIEFHPREDVALELTGAPDAFVKLPFHLNEPINAIRLSMAFLSESDGAFSLEVDGVPLLTTTEEEGRSWGGYVDGQIIRLAAPIAQGSHTLTLRVQSGTTPTSIQVRVLGLGSTSGGPPNQPPVGLSDGYRLSEDSMLSVPAAQGILSNDQDPDGDKLHSQLITEPANGTLTLSSDGSFQFIPLPNLVGDDQFVYQVVDSRGARSDDVIVSLTIEPRNDPPVILLPPQQALQFQRTTLDGIQVTDVDAGTNTLTVVVEVSGGWLVARSDVPGGVDSASIDGNRTSRIELTGAQEDINRTLAASKGIQYYSRSESDVSITVTADDHGAGGSDGEAASSAQATLTISVQLPPWHNAQLPSDVDGSGFVTTEDLLSVLAELSLNGPRDLTEADTTSNWLDVVPDGRLLTDDLVEIVATLVLQDQGGESEGELGEPSKDGSPDVKAPGYADSHVANNGAAPGHQPDPTWLPVEKQRQPLIDTAFAELYDEIDELVDVGS